MKYKVLINSKKTALAVDFIQHSEAFFKTISTTDCLQDVLGHFECFQPDAFVCFVDTDYGKTISMINALKEYSEYNGAAIFVVGDSSTCDKIEETARYSANAVIRRPITQDNLTLRITRYFDELKEAEERAKAAEEAKKAKQAEIDAKAEAVIAKEKEEERAAIAAAVAAKKAAAAAAGKKHILVVDDDRTILKMLQTALSDKYDVTTMANGIVVDKFLKTKKVDLIILDYEMPIETGADVFRKLKKSPENAKIPVCFLTGISEREKIMEVMSLNPHGYLLKPLDMDMLTATISNLIN